jgi:hypothetical protein
MLFDFSTFILVQVYNAAKQSNEIKDGKKNMLYL